MNTGLRFPCGEWSCPEKAHRRLSLEMGMKGGRGGGVRGALTYQQMCEKKGSIVRAKRSREI